jgi:hypothetical protein
MKTSHHARAFLGALMIASLAGCGPREAPESGGQVGSQATGHTYKVRGQVTQLPDPANPGSGLHVQHEAVDDFVDREGKTVGMDPMNMPFPVADGVSLEGIAPADYVEFDLHVDWQADSPVAITRLHKLPPDTRLVFRAAQPPTPGKS